jgi:hypothetical protein
MLYIHIYHLYYYFMRETTCDASPSLWKNRMPCKNVKRRFCEPHETHIWFRYPKFATSVFHSII